LSRLKASFFSLVLILLVTISLAYNNFPRNIDPSQVKEEGPSPIELLSLYASIGKFASSLDFKSSLNVSSLLGKIYIPQNLLYVFQRFNSLLNETLSQMNTTNYYVNLASSYVSISDFKDAEKYIYNASKGLALTKISYDELYDASSEFSRSTGIYYEKLTEVLNDIETGIKKLEASIDNLQNKIESTKPRLVNTFLNISVKPLNVTYGEEITVTGSLYDESNNVLPSREVLVHIGSKEYTAKTNSFGSYVFSYRVVDYVQKLTIHVEYIPKGDDFGKFSYTSSKIVYVNISYITPRLKVSLSQSKVKPMDKVKLYVNSLPNLELRISFLSSKIEGSTDDSGNFIYELTIPSNVSEGVNSIVVSSLPREVVGPSQTSVEFLVYKLDLNYSVEVPSLVITGVPFVVRVSTDKNSTIALVSPSLGRIFVNHSLTLSKGITLPLTYLDGNFSFFVKLTPDEPWYRSSYKIFSVKVVNTLGILLLVPLFAVLASQYLSKVRRKAYEKRVEESKNKSEFHSLKEKEYPYPSNLFFKLVSLIERAFRVVMKPSETLREYLRKISNIPKDLYEEIFDLFLSYEKFVYGGPRYKDKSFSEEIAEKMKSLIDKLRGGEET